MSQSHSDPTSATDKNNDLETEPELEELITHLRSLVEHVIAINQWGIIGSGAMLLAVIGLLGALWESVSVFCLNLLLISFLFFSTGFLAGVLNHSHLLTARDRQEVSNKFKPLSPWTWGTPSMLGLLCLSAGLYLEINGYL